MLPSRSTLLAMILLPLVACGASSRTDSATAPGPTLSAVNSIAVDSAVLALTVGTSSAITVTLKDAQDRVIPAAERTVTWTNSFPAIAALSSVVGASVTVQGVSTGTTTLVATCEGKAVSITVLVAQPVQITSLVLVPNTVVVYPGATQQFSVTARRSGDSDTPVAADVVYSATGGTVSPTGLFTAGIVPGAAYLVTATLASNRAVTGQANVTVSAPPPVAPGVWTNVTPRNVDLTNSLSCGNFGVENVQVDPAQPSNVYALFHCQGIWKSVDYGRTWAGPINKGSNGGSVSDCAGGVRIAPTAVTTASTIYLSCIRGAGIGFWRSVDGGVGWTRYSIAPAARDRQDVYPPSVDPYDPKHLIMAGHEQDLVVESIDGGQHWTNVAMNAGMRAGNGTGSVSFINTGSASSTRFTWLWMAQQSGGIYGTWRTTNAGVAWTQVDKNEHPHGFAEAYQPGASGVVYIAGAYSQFGWGVLRSADYGVTWAHVGSSGNQRVIFGTPTRVYSSYSYPTGLGASDGPSFQVAPQPGTSGWVSPVTPAAMTQGASQVAVTTDGTRYYLISANYGAGLWLYLEP